jgi:predicted transcriptional regulator of viral defense system
MEKKYRKSFQRAVDIFRAHRGILRVSQANELGIHFMVLSQMVEEGLLVKEGRGLYRLAELPPLSNPDLFLAALRIPSGVICLISALNFHDLTTQIPYKVYIALPRGVKRPLLEYPPLEIIWPGERIYSTGIAEHVIDGVSIKVYCKEKTIADCFRYSKKVEREIAIEALKDYLGGRERNLNLLYEYARLNKVEKEILPYVKALT